mmetsp:Transcript_1791/g.5451  ORF Transcript_1791/g.5451 Transcript_1791/m.5451 type:complete len:211 (-) Transcript_1791:21-653(-)
MMTHIQPRCVTSSRRPSPCSISDCCGRRPRRLSLPWRAGTSTPCQTATARVRGVRASAARRREPSAPAGAPSLSCAAPAACRSCPAAAAGRRGRRSRGCAAAAEVALAPAEAPRRSSASPPSAAAGRQTRRGGAARRRSGWLGWPRSGWLAAARRRSPSPWWLGSRPRAVCPQARPPGRRRTRYVTPTAWSRRRKTATRAAPRTQSGGRR